MSAAKRVRWECPNGCAGVLGPQRPRRDDVRRYCLTCSAKTGRLVERVSPALERKRQQSAERSREKARRAREREQQADRERWEVGGVDLRDAWKKALTLPALKPAARRASWKTLRRSAENPTRASGRAWAWGDVSLTIGVSCRPEKAVAVLLHELAHVACAAAGEPWGDADAAFGRRCLDALDEWNERYGSRVVEVDRDGHGSPYRGRHGRAIRERRARRRS